MFQAAKDARITPNDFAKVMGVSRVTASLWFNGHNKPHHLIRKRVEEALDCIRKGLNGGDFPVPYEVVRRERYLYIQKVINKHQVSTLESEPPAVSE
jgi:transcriptional regulator with XRE-family HTH domain